MERYPNFKEVFFPATLGLCFHIIEPKVVEEATYGDMCQYGMLPSSVICFYIIINITNRFHKKILYVHNLDPYKIWIDYAYFPFKV